MKPAPTHPNEKERLAALRALEILDTAPEERFDRLTRLAQRLFDVPIALVSLVDGNRQWFKSRAGLDATETPRDISFCGHAVMEQKVFLIPDASKDTRFADNPLVTKDPKIRFYAGYPLSAPGGEKVGSFCVIDRKPRTFSPVEIRFLTQLGTLVEEELARGREGLEERLSGVSEGRFFGDLLGYVVDFSRAMDFPISVLLVHSREGAASASPGSADRRLVETSKLLGSSIRRSDIIGRLGADSFYAFLPRCPREELAGIVERLHTNLAALNRSGAAGRPLEVVCADLLWTPSGTEGVEEILRRAEESLRSLERASVASAPRGAIPSP